MKLQKLAVRRYVQNRWTIRRIADELGVSYGTAWGLLHDGGVTFRGRGGSVPAKARWSK